MNARYISFIVISLLFYSCSLGPRTLSHTPLQYNRSAQLTQNEQMLLNLVRVRYFEQPFFLQIGSISTSYTYGASAEAAAEIPNEQLESVGVINIFTGSLTGSYTEVPTFTLTPLHGNDYYKHLLENIDVSQLTLLENWRFEFVMDFMVERIGNVYNTFGGQNKSYKDFLALKGTLSRIHDRRNLEFIYEVTASGKSKQVVYYMKLTYANKEEAEKVEALLGVANKHKSKAAKPLTGIYRLSISSELSTKKEDKAGRPIIPFKLLSFLEVLSLMGQCVDVPEDHLKKGVAMGNEKSGGYQYGAQLIRIQQSSSRPRNAFLGVKYRNHWFYIEDMDLQSKLAFAYLNMLYTLQSRSVSSQTPALTIPVR